MTKMLRFAARQGMLAALLVGLSACADTSDKGAAGGFEPVTAADLQTATLTFATFGDRALTLVDGRWDDPAGTGEWLELLPDWSGVGDFDADETMETAGVARIFHLDYGEVYLAYSVEATANGPVVQADRPLGLDIEIESFEVADNQLVIVSREPRGANPRAERIYRILNGRWELASHRSLREANAS
jgi:hypothetical protein